MTRFTLMITLSFILTLLITHTVHCGHHCPSFLCYRLKQQLTVGELNHSRKMSEFEKEEKHIREENLRLQRKLQLEMERREALCRLPVHLILCVCC